MPGKASEIRLRVEEWTDRDGKQRHTLEVHATDMQFVGSDSWAYRAWCPLHDGLWARLIVRTAEDSNHTFECARGCSQGEIEAFIAANSDPAQAA